MNTQGQLSAVETFSLIRNLMVRRLALSRRRPSPTMRVVAEVRLPSTALAEWSLQVCRDASAPWLVNHSIRTYIWGATLARRDGVTFDDELAWVASMFHDMALTAAHVPPIGCCFAVHGANNATSLLHTRGESAERTARVADAIARHIDLEVPLSLGEARVVHEGAAFDVIGARFNEITAESRDAAVTQFPRGNFKREVIVALRSVSRRSPNTRMAWMRRVGFSTLIARSRFADNALI